MLEPNEQLDIIDGTMDMIEAIIGLIEKGLPHQATFELGKLYGFLETEKELIEEQNKPQEKQEQENE